MGGFRQGVADLARGFAFWRRRPGVMALGLVPALVVAAVFGAALVWLATSLPAIATGLTPFADDWPAGWTVLVRVGVALATFAAAVALAAVTFTAVTLVVGEPFYDRIWRAVEADAGGVPDGETGMWRAVRDAIGLFTRGVGVAILTWLVGLVPVVGGIAGAVVGLLLTGRLLADELSSRAFAARGIDGRERRRLLRSIRGRALGFGVGTQLCFLVPLGAVVVMPAAVAGSTLLARAALDGEARISSASSPASAPAPPG
ncbi:EI24 domain-containing protein [Microbacterium sp. NPDC091313]